MLKTITTNALGRRVGESNPSHLYSDAQVAQARAMYAAGATTGEISKAVGAHPATVWRWVTRRRRNPPTSVRVVRVKPESFDANRQPEGAGQREEGARLAVDTVDRTDVSDLI